jgi:predicted transposase YdaD
MALYPLCRHDRTPGAALRYAAGAIKATTPDTIMRADLLTTLAIFGRLTYRRLDVVGLIGREHMKESPLYEEIKDEGRVETRQRDILAILKERFGSETATHFAAPVNRIAKLDKLDRLLRLAVHCNTPDEFQKGLRRR